jgi:hypothetical protein
MLCHIFIPLSGASGGLLADVGDVARFVSAGMTGPFYSDHGVLGQERIVEIYGQENDIPGMFGLDADAYGFSHFIELLPDGGKAVWHGAGARSFAPDAGTNSGSVNTVPPC